MKKVQFLSHAGVVVIVAGLAACNANSEGDGVTPSVTSPVVRAARLQLLSRFGQAPQTQGDADDAAVSDDTNADADDSLSRSASAKYRLIDMGTFGGPSSQGTNETLAGPLVATGWSATPMRKPKDSNRVICGGQDGLIKYITHTFEWRHGRISDLGSLGGNDSCSIPFWINAHGVIAGMSENGKFDHEIGTNQSRPVLWQNDEIRDVGTFGGDQGLALDVNDSGQATGMATNRTPDQFSFLDILILLRHKGTQTRGFLWDKGKLTDIGTLGGNDTYAEFINRRGEISGSSYVNDAPNSTTGIPTMDPFLWRHGKMKDFGTLGGVFGVVNAMNDNGWVVGQSDLVGDTMFHPFVWNGSVMIDIGTAGGSFGQATAINNRGEVVGKTTTAGDQYEVAFAWKDGVRTDLPPLKGDCTSQAWGVDSRGIVVGNSTSCGTKYPQIADKHVVIWDHGMAINVNRLVAKNASLQIAVVGPYSEAGPEVINDRGDIAGIGVRPGVPHYKAYLKGRAFLLIPIGDPEH